MERFIPIERLGATSSKIPSHLTSTMISSDFFVPGHSPFYKTGVLCARLSTGDMLDVFVTLLNQLDSFTREKSPSSRLIVFPKFGLIVLALLPNEQCGSLSQIQDALLGEVKLLQRSREYSTRYRRLRDLGFPVALSISSHTTITVLPMSSLVTLVVTKELATQLKSTIGCLGQSLNTLAIQTKAAVESFSTFAQAVSTLGLSAKNSDVRTSE